MRDDATHAAARCRTGAVRMLAVVRPSLLRPVLLAAAVLGGLSGLAVIPASASAVGAGVGAKPASVTVPPGGIAEVPPVQLDELLAQAQLGEEGIPLNALETSLLAKILEERPGISALASVNGLGGAAGVKRALVKAIGEAVEEDDELGELLEFGLAIDFEEHLEDAFEESGVSEQPGGPEDLEEAVERALGKDPEEVIEEGLGSLTLDELLSRLVREGSHPVRLTGALFRAIEAEELEEVLGTTLSAEPFSRADVAEVAQAIGITPTELAAKLGDTPSELPETAIALLTPLHNGQSLGVFGGLQGLSFGLIGTAPPPVEEPEEPEEEEPEEPAEVEEPTESPAGSSSFGETAGSGSGATSAGGSAALANPAPALLGSTTQPPSAAAQPPAAVQRQGAPAAKLKILSHRLDGHTLTIVLQVPAAGRLTVRGKDLRGVHRNVARAEHLTLTTGASVAGAASLREKHRLKVELHASLRTSDGSSASTTLALVLR
jgi:hypothetical protein